MSERADVIAPSPDWHCGSQDGLLPPNFSWKKETFAQNAGQEYTWRCWREWIDWLPPRIDLLVLLGDLIDGDQRKSRGRGLVTPRGGTQARIAMAVARPLCLKSRKIVRCLGTPYHEGHDGPLEVFDDEYGVENVEVKFDLETAPGCVMNFAHKIGGGSAIYKGTVVDREVLWSKICADASTNVKARYLVRGHIHFYLKWDVKGATAVVAPGWQLQTKYALIQQQYRWKPNLGGVCLKRDEEESGGYRVRRKLFDLPEWERRSLPYGDIRDWREVRGGPPPELAGGDGGEADGLPPPQGDPGVPAGQES